ncbi:hypothetical protein Tco_0127308 [Tanacetum coccineum]
MSKRQCSSAVMSSRSVKDKLLATSSGTCQGSLVGSGNDEAQASGDRSLNEGMRCYVIGLSVIPFVAFLVLHTVEICMEWKCSRLVLYGQKIGEK